MERDDKDDKKMELLMEEIRKNLWGCDLILCLFIAALKSYRADRCLRPFPGFYVDHEEKDFTALRKTCDRIPSFRTVLSEPNKCPADVRKLLVWLLVERKQPVVRRVPFDSVSFPSKIINTLRPHFLFEVCYCEKFELQWQNRLQGRDAFFAYHGSAIDNFYSILKVGLQQHFSVGKEVLFGTGIYLSNELSVSAHYAPFSQTWTHSSLGKRHSVIAICQIINDDKKVKCRDIKNRGRSMNEDSLGQIPEKYFVVTDSEMVRVKYLMVYREKNIFSVKSFLVKHLFLCLLVLYILMVIGIKMFSRGSPMKYLKNIQQLFSL